MSDTKIEATHLDSSPEREDNPEHVVSEMSKDSVLSTLESIE